MNGVIFTVTFISEGSVNLGVAGTSDGTTTTTGGSSPQSAIASTVDSTISGGDLGIPLISSSVGLFYEDSTYTEPTSSSGSEDTANAAMIAGIVVGVVAFVAIIGLSIYWYKKNRGQADIKPDSET